MYRKYQNIISFLSLFLFSTLLLGVVGCDALLPDKFEEEKFSSQAIDVKASNMLSRDTTGYYLDTTSYYNNFGGFYHIRSRTMLSMVDPATQALLIQDSITEDQIILSSYDALINSIGDIPLVRDSLLFVQIDSAASVVYGVLNISAGQSKDFYLYTSLMYNQYNINEYISVRLIKRDASAVTFSEDMPMETVSSGSQLIPVAGGTILVPTVKARYRIHADEGIYLVRFTKSNVLGFGPFVKILILSL